MFSIACVTCYALTTALSLWPTFQTRSNSTQSKMTEPGCTLSRLAPKLLQLRLWQRPARRGQTQIWLPPAAGAPAGDGELHATPPPASCQKIKIKKVPHSSFKFTLK